VKQFISTFEILFFVDDYNEKTSERNNFSL